MKLFVVVFFLALGVMVSGGRSEACDRDTMCGRGGGNVEDDISTNANRGDWEFIGCAASVDHCAHAAGVGNYEYYFAKPDGNYCQTGPGEPNEGHPYACWGK